MANYIIYNPLFIRLLSLNHNFMQILAPRFDPITGSLNIMDPNIVFVRGAAKMTKARLLDRYEVAQVGAIKA